MLEIGRQFLDAAIESEFDRGVQDVIDIQKHSYSQYCRTVIGVQIVRIRTRFQDV